jgi:hypothetical protein
MAPTVIAFFSFLHWLSLQSGEAVYNGYAGCTMVAHPVCGKVFYGGNALQAFWICIETGYRFVLGGLS